MFEFSMDNIGTNERKKINLAWIFHSECGVYSRLASNVVYDVVLIFFDGFIYTRIDEIVC